MGGAPFRETGYARVPAWGAGGGRFRRIGRPQPSDGHDFRPPCIHGRAWPVSCSEWLASGHSLSERNSPANCVPLPRLPPTAHSGAWKSCRDPPRGRVGAGPMPASWRGFLGGMGRGAVGAAPDFMAHFGQGGARQSVATPTSLTTLRRNCGISAIGGHTRGGSCQPHWHRVDPHVSFQTISVTDGDAGEARRS